MSQTVKGDQRYLVLGTDPGHDPRELVAQPVRMEVLKVRSGEHKVVIRDRFRLQAITQAIGSFSLLAEHLHGLIIDGHNAT